MKRTKVNPTDWADAILDQGQIIEGATRLLTLSGQVSVTPDADAPLGVRALHPNDIRGQMLEALTQIDAVLDVAGMTRENLVHLRFFVTDMQAGLANFDVFLDWIADVGHRPPQSFIGISELFLPELMIEIEATAAS